MVAATRPHGTRARYVFGPGPGQDRAAGCRCDDCCDANRAYARMQRKRKSLEVLGRTSGPFASPFVDASEVRDRILAFADLGVGYKRLGELAGVSKSSLLEVRAGRRDRIRRDVADRVLAVPLEADGVADGQVVDAGETWKLIRRILRLEGWSKARISTEIGQGGRALQLGRRRITARNARAVEELAARLGIFATTDADARRFDAAPLLEGRTTKGLARAIGVDARQVYRWREYGIPADRADEVACTLGYHPAELWPDWYAAEVAS